MLGRLLFGKDIRRATTTRARKLARAMAAQWRLAAARREIDASPHLPPREPTIGSPKTKPPAVTGGLTLRIEQDPHHKTVDLLEISTGLGVAAGEAVSGY
jgi:hypothetical protein